MAKFVILDRAQLDYKSSSNLLHVFDAQDTAAATPIAHQWALDNGYQPSAVMLGKCFDIPTIVADKWIFPNQEVN